MQTTPVTKCSLFVSLVPCIQEMTTASAFIFASASMLLLSNFNHYIKVKTAGVNLPLLHKLTLPLVHKLKPQENLTIFSCLCLPQPDTTWALQVNWVHLAAHFLCKWTTNIMHSVFFECISDYQHRYCIRRTNNVVLSFKCLYTWKKNDFSVQNESVIINYLCKILRIESSKARRSCLCRLLDCNAY